MFGFFISYIAIGFSFIITVNSPYLFFVTFFFCGLGIYYNINSKEVN
jgi:hypothetical protein